MRGALGGILLLAYYIGAPITFIYLTFFDGYQYTWWNWIFVVPINGFLSAMWPIYWAVLRPFFG